MRRTVLAKSGHETEAQFTAACTRGSCDTVSTPLGPVHAHAVASPEALTVPDEAVCDGASRAAWRVEKGARRGRALFDVIE